jgi:hypothetical protein
MAIKENCNKGYIITNIGGLFVIIGIVLMTMESASIFIFSFLIIGIVLSVYGMFSSSKVKKE